MNFFRQATEIINNDTEDDNYGLLYEDEPEPMCNITNNKTMFFIHSNRSPASLLKFDQDSFCFQSNDGLVQLHFNPMFLWRLLLFQQKNLKKDDIDLDFVRIRTFVSKCIRATRNFAIIVSEKNISYKQDGIVVNKRMYGSVLHTNLMKAFDQLYLSLKRNYDSHDLLVIMFDACIRVLYFLSC
jgi:hypothetical protein